MSGKPLIVAALGARGTGKSAWCNQVEPRMRGARYAAWDLMREQPGGTDNLGEAVRAMQARSFSSVFYPSRDDAVRARQFDLWCRACLAAGRLLARVEELAYVTTAWKAPGPWREMVLLGRHPQHRVAILANSQRPAQIDKDFLGNCDLVHCGRLVARADAKVAAEVLGVDFRELMRLPDLAYIERKAGALEPTRGTVTFSQPQRVPRAKPSGRSPQAANLQPTAAVPETAPVPTEPRERPAFNPLEPWK